VPAEPPPGPVETSGAWLAVGLGVLVLIVGLALVGLALGRPFLPLP
jgi:hypothetical protein